MLVKLTREELQQRLKEALETWPLYRELSYELLMNEVLLPKEISRLCEGCGTVKVWETRNQFAPQTENNKRGLGEKQYTCKNCGKAGVTYYYYWKAIDAQTSTFFKVGQYPMLEETVDPALENALASEDLKLYKKAIRLRNFNYGLGAVAYMRRVVENSMNDLLSVLHDAAEESDVSAEVLDKLTEVKNGRRFSEKIDYAALLLTERLRPRGSPNPIELLHDLTSDSVHARSEEECVDTFDECDVAFQYLFSKLREEVKGKKQYRKVLSELGKRRPIT